MTSKAKAVRQVLKKKGKPTRTQKAAKKIKRGN